MNETSHITPTESAQAQHWKYSRTGNRHPGLRSTLACRPTMDLDYNRNGRLAFVMVVVHAWHLQAIEALELEQFRRVHLEQRRTRRSLAIRLRRDVHEEIPLLITLRLDAILKYMGKIERGEESVHAERVEVHDELVRPPIAPVRGVPDGRAFPVAHAYLEHLASPCDRTIPGAGTGTGVGAGEEWHGIHGFPTLNIGTKEERGWGDEQARRLPRDRPERMQVQRRFGSRDVEDCPGERVVRDDAREIAKRIRDEVQHMRLSRITGEPRAAVRRLLRFLRHA